MGQIVHAVLQTCYPYTDVFSAVHARMPQQDTLCMYETSECMLREAAAHASAATTLQRQCARMSGRAAAAVQTAASSATELLRLVNEHTCAVRAESVRRMLAYDKASEDERHEADTCAKLLRAWAASQSGLPAKLLLRFPFPPRSFVLLERLLPDVPFLELQTEPDLDMRRSSIRLKSAYDFARSFWLPRHKFPNVIFVQPRNQAGETLKWVCQEDIQICVANPASKYAVVVCDTIAAYAGSICVRFAVTLRGRRARRGFARVKIAVHVLDQRVGVTSLQVALLI